MFDGSFEVVDPVSRTRHSQPMPLCRCNANGPGGATVTSIGADSAEAGPGHATGSAAALAGVAALPLPAFLRAIPGLCDEPPRATGDQEACYNTAVQLLLRVARTCPDLDFFLLSGPASLMVRVCVVRTCGCVCSCS